MIKAYAAHKPSSKLEPFEYEPGSLKDEEIEVEVEYCGICYSDVHLIDNDWKTSQYPLVPGHEIVGVIALLGKKVTHLKVGQRVGIGWNSHSCMTCANCMSGDHNLCFDRQAIVAVGRHGGFADRVRVDAARAIPIPELMNPEKAGPFLCAGITVFNPIEQFNVKPTDRVGVIGIGGLGHLAVQFLNAWGCEVTAFSSHPDKEAEARELGADNFINSRDPEILKKWQNYFDFIISTVHVDLQWSSYLAALRSKGKLTIVGVNPNPIEVSVLEILGQKSLSSSHTGSPATIFRMLEFAARHQIEPITETFPIEQVNDAIAHLKAGKARYRVVLKV